MTRPTTITTKHTHPVIFGRRVAGCPRCAELDAGAPPIEWSSTIRKREELRRIREIREHDCKRSGCMPICTFGDW